MTEQGSSASLPVTNIDRWRRFISEGALDSVPMEEIVAAVQDLGPYADPRVLNPLMLHITDALTRLLRKRVWRSHPNEGNDIIERAHETIIGAVLQPQSADGKGLRECFEARVALRLKDAIRAERQNARRHPSADEDGDSRPLPTPDAGYGSHVVMEEHAHVEALIAMIDDHRKRLAWRLHMEGVPIESKKVKGTIAQATGVSGRQVQDWLDEVKEFLKSKMGDRA